MRPARVLTDLVQQRECRDVPGTGSVAARRALDPDPSLTPDDGTSQALP